MTVRLPTTMLDNRPDEQRKTHSLLVMGPHELVNHTLPASGVLTIGRAETADVRLDDPMASRLHARLHVGPLGTFEVEDLGSANRTRVRDLVLAPAERVALVPGEAITIGSTILMVQESRNFVRPRRLWPHAYFEARLEEEVARSEQTRAPFAAVRLHVDGELGPAPLTDALGPALRLTDMLAVYAPGEYELLLPQTPPELASAIARDIGERLRSVGVVARTGIACYPRDGRTPEQLLGLACDRVRGAAGVVASGGEVVVRDPAMQRTYQMIERVAAGQISVLLVGETGVGKEILAAALHRLSPRARAPYVCLSCAAFPEALLESELFGHERGAFTGAVEAKPGLLETAPGGTIFLDELGEMASSTQGKLLRVIETRQVIRVGGVKPRPIDVRFVAATNKNIQAEAAAGRFRPDLYYRLNGITLHVPPLRERRSEILPLAQVFLEHYAARLGRATPQRLGAEVEQMLLAYTWPGNIRELRNVIERATLLCGGDEIGPEHLQAEMMVTNSTPATPGDERARILQALDLYAGNQSRAAKHLRMARSTFVHKLDEHQIPRPRKPTS